MNLLWFIAAVSLLAALLAWRKARATEKRVEQLSHMYWELKYQHGELRVQVERLTGGGPRVAAAPETATPPGESFVSLASLKR